MLIINHGKCVECATCVKECHRSALSLGEDGLKWDVEKCYGCGHCMALCPREALLYDGDGYDISEVEEFNFAARAKEEQVREMIMMKRSVRNFTDNEVSDEDLEKILEAGKYSATAENRQGNVFLVIRSEEKRKEILDDSMSILKKLCDDVIAGTSSLFSKTLAQNLKNVARTWEETGEDRLFHGAPLFLYIFSDTIQDGAIAACQMSNMAYGLRLGSCYIRIGSDIFADEGLRKKYGIPEGKIPTMALAIGEPDVEFFCTVPRKNPQITIF